MFQFTCRSWSGQVSVWLTIRQVLSALKHSFAPHFSASRRLLSQLTDDGGVCRLGASATGVCLPEAIRCDVVVRILADVHLHQIARFVEQGTTLLAQMGQV